MRRLPPSTGFEAPAGCVRSPALHKPKVVPNTPAQAPPEVLTGPVAGKEKQVALGNARLSEPLKADLDQGLPDSLAPPFTGDGEVMQVSPPAIVATQHYADHVIAGNGNFAEARVPSKVSSNRTAIVGFVQADAL